MPLEKTATLIGSTGLIGSYILTLLLKDNDFKSVKILVRRPISIQHPKLKVEIIDFSDESALKQSIKGSDIVFCSVGTTQQKVKGDMEAYRKVDFDIPINVAKASAEVGCSHFLLVSSVGADSSSSNFYLKLKGEVEDAIKKMNISSVSIFRPSLLLGKREELRLGEQISQILMPVFSFLIPSNYKPIKAEDVAKSMVAVSKKEIKGFNVYHFKEMKD